MGFGSGIVPEFYSTEPPSRRTNPSRGIRLYAVSHKARNQARSRRLTLLPLFRGGKPRGSGSSDRTTSVSTFFASDDAPGFDRYKGPNAQRHDHTVLCGNFKIVLSTQKTFTNSAKR